MGRLLFGFGDIKYIANSGDYLVELRDDVGLTVDTPDAFRAAFAAHNAEFLLRKKNLIAEGQWSAQRSPKQLLRNNQIDCLEKAGCWDDMGVRAITMTERQKNELEMLGVILTDNTVEVLERNAEVIAEECDSWEEMLTPFYEKNYCYGEKAQDQAFYEYQVCGIVVSVLSKISNATGKPFGIVTIEYESDTVEFMVFSQKWPRFKSLFKLRTVGLFTLRHRPKGDYPEGYIYEAGRKLI
jgi:DNA polymerase III alpha subunit